MQTESHGTNDSTGKTRIRVRASGLLLRRAAPSYSCEQRDRTARAPSAGLAALLLDLEGTDGLLDVHQIVVQVVLVLGVDLTVELEHLRRWREGERRERGERVSDPAARGRGIIRSLHQQESSQSGF